MCGIVGWIDWSRDLSGEGEQIGRMADTMRRRGPDERGTWLTKHAALGHRRLSVIDLAHGQQPMTFSDGDRTFSLVYNGELYNFPELREELIALGHAFRTRCDTESAPPRLCRVGRRLRSPLRRHLRVRHLGRGETAALSRT